MIKDIFENKKILIWGYGREGKSSEKYIRENCNVRELEIFEGDFSDIELAKWDLILKSPGIYLKNRPENVTSETEIFLNEFANQTIGITGTKGKSTTSSLMHSVLTSCGKKSILLGNIGKPCFDYINEIDPDTYIVFELSCHQLMHIKTAPAHSIFLNLYPEHLDYYGNIDDYFKAKANIVLKQKKGGIALIGENVPEIRHDSKQIIVRDSAEKDDIRLHIPGEHNKLNALFVKKMAVDVLGLPEASVSKGLFEFTGLPHRLEFFKEIDGTKYYDDSISTIPEATINAAKSIPGADVILIGGMDRGIDYSVLVDFVCENTNIKFILMYETGKRILNEIKEKYKTVPQNIYCVDELSEAVKCAVNLRSKGKAVILSPAAASYGYFKNFEERGDKFKEYVNEIQA